MTTLFYIIVALLFIYELFALVLEKAIFESKKRHREKINAKKENGEKITINDLSESILFYYICTLLFYIITVVGFLSSQWVLFIIIFVLKIIPKKYLWLKCVHRIITLLLLAFILINKFHLHITLF